VIDVAGGDDIRASVTGVIRADLLVVNKSDWRASWGFDLERCSARRAKSERTPGCVTNCALGEEIEAIVT